jgi:hypothetical protein
MGPEYSGLPHQQPQSIKVYSGKHVLPEMIFLPTAKNAIGLHQSQAILPSPTPIT